ncbi:MAG: twin-arginine translocase subunit TatC [Planctomycetes bacterium]|nr:twin-arginine translocase subunit TatC [Planctomycetota bacterium]
MKPEAVLDTDAANDPADDAVGETSRMSFGDHLEELRSYLIRAMIGLALSTALCLVFGKNILSLIFHPLLVVQEASGMNPHLQVLSPSGAFTAYLKIGILSGMILSMPWVLYQMWSFVATGLFKRERRFVRLLVPASTGLFVAGVMFMYFIVLPIVLRFFISFNNSFPLHDLSPTVIERAILSDRPTPSLADGGANALKVPMLEQDPSEPRAGDLWVNATRRRLMFMAPTGLWSMPFEVGAMSPAIQSQFAIDYYISFVLMLALGFGVAFETPVVVYFLARTGLVTTTAMKRGRRYVLLGAVLSAAMLTPPDIISQLLLAGPIYLLFELGLLFARAVERKAAARSQG